MQKAAPDYISETAFLFLLSLLDASREAYRSNEDCVFAQLPNQQPTAYEGSLFD